LSARANRERELTGFRVHILEGEDGAAAIKLYEKLGFVVEDVKKRGRKLNGVYDDVIEMVLFI